MKSSVASLERTVAFLSDLCGREGDIRSAFIVLIFLSDLCGREESIEQTRTQIQFLSDLCGREVVKLLCLAGLLISKRPVRS